VLAARGVIRGALESMIRETREGEARGRAARAAGGPGDAAAHGGGAKRVRAIKPGSFLSLLVNARHASGEHLSELEAAAQAFDFLLAGARRGRPADSGVRVG